MNDEHVEIEECVVEESSTHVVGSSPQKASLKRQITLDAFLSNKPSRKIFVNDELIHKKTKNKRMSIVITHSGR